MKLNKEAILTSVRQALKEDLGSGDVSAVLLSDELKAEAEILSREPLLICGYPWVEAVFAEINPQITLDWLVKEGSWINQASSLCRIKGSARAILTAERTALNFLQTLSATATQTHRYLQAMIGSKTRLLDTRKTIPGLRYAQKYAVASAGGFNHRMGLYDAILIKENHIKVCGSIARAIENARRIHPNFFVEVEVENLAELVEALEAKPDRILLDNFSKEMLIEAVKMNQSYSCELEASGGIDLSNIAEFAQIGLDYISVGAITKSIKAIDLSLLIRVILS